MTTSPGVNSSSVASTMAPETLSFVWEIRKALNARSLIWKSLPHQLADRSFSWPRLCSLRSVALITPTVQRWLDDARRDPDAFWDRAARELPWFRTWDKVFDWDPPTFRWFVGAETNLAYNAVDRH